MSKWKQAIGKRMWIGVLIALAVSFLLDSGGAVLMCRGIIPEMPMWVYGAYSAGSFIGVRAAVRRENGTMLRAAVMWLILCGSVVLAGIAAYGGITFRTHGVGVMLGLLSGCLCGGLLGSGRIKRQTNRKKRPAVRR
ncbi:MAG: hypothetical protein KBS74_05735 [Clostridiales bacterium]|nr:hypothetical protein [Candidatus Cacconaster stercorequi]